MLWYAVNRVGDISVYHKYKDKLILRCELRKSSKNVACEWWETLLYVSLYQQSWQWPSVPLIHYRALLGQCRGTNVQCERVWVQTVLMILMCAVAFHSLQVFQTIKCPFVHLFLSVSITIERDDIMYTWLE